MSHKTWCNTTCLWFFQQQLQIFCLAQKIYSCPAWLR
ncbi:hypothetical protein GYH30_052410 [Glycine max]|nr:hypothetical protein GYH30_052410 [Glycine max]